MTFQEHVVQIEVQRDSADGPYYIAALCTCGHVAKFPRGIGADVLYESIGEHTIQPVQHSAHNPKPASPARTALDRARDSVADALRERADMLVHEARIAHADGEITARGRTPVHLRVLAQEMEWLSTRLSLVSSTPEDTHD